LVITIRILLKLIDGTTFDCRDELGYIDFEEKMPDFVTMKYFTKENFPKIGSKLAASGKSANLSGFIISNIQNEMPNLSLN
jgi:hypothetical protein